MKIIINNRQGRISFDNGLECPLAFLPAGNRTVVQSMNEGMPTLIGVEYFGESGASAAKSLYDHLASLKRREFQIDLSTRQGPEGSIHRMAMIYDPDNCEAIVRG